MACHLFIAKPVQEVIVNWTCRYKLNGMLLKIRSFSFKKMHLKLSLAMWQTFCWGFHMLTHCGLVIPYRSWSTLAQVTLCCLTAPSHYLNQSWLLIRKVLWHSSESNFTASAQAMHWVWKLYFKLTVNTVTSPRGQWVNLYGPSSGTSLPEH